MDVCVYICGYTPGSSKVENGDAVEAARDSEGFAREIEKLELRVPLAVVRIVHLNKHLQPIRRLKEREKDVVKGKEEEEDEKSDFLRM